MYGIIKWEGYVSRARKKPGVIQALVFSHKKGGFFGFSGFTGAVKFYPVSNFFQTNKKFQNKNSRVNTLLFSIYKSCNLFLNNRKLVPLF